MRYQRSGPVQSPEKEAICSAFSVLLDLKDHSCLWSCIWGQVSRALALGLKHHLDSWILQLVNVCPKFHSTYLFLPTAAFWVWRRHSWNASLICLHVVHQQPKHQCRQAQTCQGASQKAPMWTSTCHRNKLFAGSMPRFVMKIFIMKISVFLISLYTLAWNFQS